MLVGEPLSLGLILTFALEDIIKVFVLGEGMSESGSEQVW